MRCPTVPVALVAAALLLLPCGHCLNVTFSLPSLDPVPGLADAALNFTSAWDGGPTHWATRTTLNVFHVNALDEDAVCNDGSPAAYYFAPATSLDYANVWLLYLGGCVHACRGPTSLRFCRAPA